MKKIVVIFSFVFCFTATHFSFAQTAAMPGIFAYEVYQAVKITSDVVYGNNYNHFFNEEDTLKLDLYEPDSIVDYRRPVIVYIHGGGFTAGDKADDRAVKLGNHFARCGYLFSSINYRFCINYTGDTIDNFRGAYQSTQDAMSAVRFFRRYASDYCVDTSMIFMMGSSAGGAICLNAAYLDQQEADVIFDADDYGPLDGSSGNRGYPSKPTAIIACWGGVADTSWLQNETLPTQLFQGTADTVMPYVYGIAFNGVYSFGSYAINQASLANGIESHLHPFAGAGHGVPTDSQQYDTLINISTDFIFDHLNAGEGSMFCNSTVTEVVSLETGSNISISSLNDGDLFIINHSQSENFRSTISVFSLEGKQVYNSALNIGAGDTVEINLPNCTAGYYLAEVRNEKFMQSYPVFLVK